MGRVEVEHDDTHPGTRVVLTGVAKGEDDRPDGWLRQAARSALDLALAPELRDDRFGDPWPPDGLVAAFEVDGDGRATGYIGGAVDRGRLQLDGLLAEVPDIGSTAENRDGTGPAQPPGRRADRLWWSLEPTMTGSGATSIELWGRPARPWHEALATSQTMTEVRALHQLRCRLPIGIELPRLDDRPFVPGRDEDALIRVNNRAFASHPDQGGMTRDTLSRAAAEPWFDPEGIRLLDDPDRPGRPVGFCWTKIHPPVSEGQPRLGEIYAIGIDPDHHGQGLGAPMTAAGLRWLADQGLTDGMLYVEADNEPALRTYGRLGFAHHRTDRAWRRDLRP